ncbi:nitrate reductase associated protein [Spirosoma validum]|uniref:Nitrate reductase associated protein n=1 Tax=Spirosoma validum TaxID=2771355 RepID=A0A927AYI2_9BACT|nr:nitrate reductase associated protein [Spirosoma validum]MBD2752114.1 nitrate reductase associated protein [Spirosoma validum]
MKPVAVAPVFFAFESDFVDSLRCIPMVVRYKLDTCGIKLKLPEWVKLTVADKARLAEQLCHTSAEINQYRLDLIELVLLRCQHRVSELGVVDATWDVLNQVPDEVQQKAVEWACNPLTIQQWLQLDVLQRFALVKLSRSGHEGRNFPRAIREFFGSL